MDTCDIFCHRLTELRLEKGVSARDMSLSLGQSESYINKIENRRTMPSMTGFFYICDYFGITPKDFFDIDRTSPTRYHEFMEVANRLNAKQIEHLIPIMRDLVKNEK